MAVAKPVRALAAVCLFLVVYLLYLVRQSPPQIRGPGDLEHEMLNDPMNEGVVLCTSSQYCTDRFRNS